MFENTSLWRINWRKYYLDTASCYLVIFNVINTTSPHFNQKRMMILSIVSQPDKCLKFIGGLFLYRVRSFLSPGIELNLRHLSSCGTMESNYGKLFAKFPSGTLRVTEKVGLLFFFLILA